MPEKCQNCGKEISIARQRRLAKFCSYKCRLQKRREVYGAQTAMSPGTCGALGELAVASDLLSRGFEVFKSVSPHAHCDLIAFKNGKLIQIEVTVGRRTPRGKLMFAPHDPTNYEVLAVFLLDGKIEYIPEISLIIDKNEAREAS